MPCFAFSAKDTPEALAGACREGSPPGEAVLGALVESLGGGSRSRGIFFPASDDDGDIVTLGQVSPADVACAVQSRAMASGAMARTQLTRLRTGAEADAAIALPMEWTPPRS